MNHANMVFLSVGGHRYALDLLNPLDAIAWGNRALSLFGPSLGKILGSIEFEKMQGMDFAKMGLMEVAGKLQHLGAMALASCGELRAAEVSAIMTEAVQRCYTPQNESLADETVFNRWFREHSGDLYPLGVMALVYLVKDFFPSQLVTAASGFLTKMQPAETAGSTQ